MSDRDGAKQEAEDFVHASRDALVSALVSAGPEQPTLCEGWQTQHLAAHIHLRETSPLAAGLVVSPLSPSLDAKTMELGDASTNPADYQQLVRRIAEGPPAAQRVGRFKSLMRLGRSRPVRGLAALSNLLEFFVHAEDVRRAQNRWAPRRLSDDYADALFKQLRAQAKLHYRSEKTGTALVRTNGDRIVAKNGSEFTFISGPAGELVMHTFGRHDHALVLIDHA